MPVKVRSGDPAFDDLPIAVEEWLASSALCFALGGSEISRTAQPGSTDNAIRGYKNGAAPRLDCDENALALWSGAFFEADSSSALDAQLRAARPDGSLFNRIDALPDDVPNGVPPRGESFDDLLRNLRFERENLQSQSESRAILAAFRVWQTNGDTTSLLSRLPILERAIEYSFRHPQRWSSELELPKRAFTLDAWPIAFQAKSSTRNAPATSSNDTKWCVHAGDACRLFEASVALAQLFRAVGQASDEEKWRERAAHLEAQINSVGWNGHFYTHQIHLDAVRLRGLDEARQLAACNVFAMNSGVCGQEQCASILREYQRRRELQLENSFCEWWSVQPPFAAESFGVAPGNDANGGCWPQIGGELARAALSHGFESYGVETLRRFHDLAVKSRRLWPWYAPDGTPGRNSGAIEYSIFANAGAAAAAGAGANVNSESETRDAQNTSHNAVAASAMLRALIEGVCGIRDEASLFSSLTLAPRWPATGQSSADVELSYAASANYVSYRWALDGGRMTLDYESKAKHVNFDLLLPRGNLPERVALNGRTHEYTLAPVEKSKYVRFSTDRKRGTVAVTLK